MSECGTISCRDAVSARRKGFTRSVPCKQRRRHQFVEAASVFVEEAFGQPFTLEGTFAKIARLPSKLNASHKWACILRSRSIDGAPNCSRARAEPFRFVPLANPCRNRGETSCAFCHFLNVPLMSGRISNCYCQQKLTVKGSWTKPSRTSRFFTSRLNFGGSLIQY